MTREEAIKKIWQMSLPKETMEILEALVPELAESEDERILASIADCVGLMGEDGNVFSNHNVTKVQVLSWLKKQKDRKPEIRVKIPKFRVGDIIQHIPLEKWDCSKKIVSIDECGYNYDLSHLGDTVSGGAIGFAFENEYELVEQKPAEWSEEDEKYLIWLCRIIHSRTVNKELSLAEESKLGKWIDKWINHEPQPVQK